jgi:hypothetical protein
MPHCKDFLPLTPVLLENGAMDGNHLKIEVLYEGEACKGEIIIRCVVQLRDETVYIFREDESSKAAIAIVPVAVTA